MKTVKEIAEAFEVSEPTVRNWLKSGEIPTWKQKLRDRKARIVMREEDVQAYLEDVFAVPLASHVVVDDNCQKDNCILIPLSELERMVEWDKGIVQNTWSAYLDLLLMAGETGQLSVTSKWLSDRWKWSEERLQKFIEDLSDAGFICAKPNLNRIVFTILGNKYIATNGIK